MRVAEIDQHHWQLVQLLNRTLLAPKIRDVLGYATFRFATGERFFSEHGYHDWGHAPFVLKVARLEKNFQEGIRTLL